MRLDDFDGFAESLQPHPTKSQILLEIDGRDRTLDHALNILAEAGLIPDPSEVECREYPHWVLIRLPHGDMREAAFRLSEGGFRRIRGLNASCLLNTGRSAG